MDYFQELQEQVKKLEDQGKKEQRQIQQRVATNLPSLVNRKCVSCATEKTCRWRSSKLQSRAILCDKCYRNEALVLTSRQCYVCKSQKTTGQWVKSKVDSSFDLCRNCWVKEHTTLANKICTNCKSNRTSQQWLKSRIVEGADLCNKCYQKEVYQLNKFISSGTSTTKSVKELVVQPLLMMGGKVGVENEVEDEEDKDDEE